MTQYDPYVIKASIPTPLATDTLRADADAVGGLTTSGLSSPTDDNSAVYVSGTNTVLKTSATIGYFAGIWNAVSGSITREGRANAAFVGSLTITVGDHAYLSETSGKLTNVPPTTSGVYKLSVGVVVNKDGYAGSSTCYVLLQPSIAIKLA